MCDSSCQTVITPDNCTLCGTSFDDAKKSKDRRRMKFPYPPNHYLCWGCFIKSMDAGIGRLNTQLARGNLDLSVEEIADIIKPNDSSHTSVKEDVVASSQLGFKVNESGRGIQL